MYKFALFTCLIGILAISSGFAQDLPLDEQTYYLQAFKHSPINSDLLYNIYKREPAEIDTKVQSSLYFGANVKSFLTAFGDTTNPVYFVLETPNEDDFSGTLHYLDSINSGSIENVGAIAEAKDGVYYFSTSDFAIHHLKLNESISKDSDLTGPLVIPLNISLTRDGSIRCMQLIDADTMVVASNNAVVVFSLSQKKVLNRVHLFTNWSTRVRKVIATKDYTFVDRIDSMSNQEILMVDNLKNSFFKRIYHKSIDLLVDSPIELLNADKNGYSYFKNERETGKYFYVSLLAGIEKSVPFSPHSKIFKGIDPLKFPLLIDHPISVHSFSRAEALRKKKLNSTSTVAAQETSSLPAKKPNFTATLRITQIETLNANAPSYRYKIRDTHLFEEQVKWILTSEAMPSYLKDSILLNSDSKLPSWFYLDNKNGLYLYHLESGKKIWINDYIESIATYEDEVLVYNNYTNELISYDKAGNETVVVSASIWIDPKKVGVPQKIQALSKDKILVLTKTNLVLVSLANKVRGPEVVYNFKFGDEVSHIEKIVDMLASPKLADRVWIHAKQDSQYSSAAKNYLLLFGIDLKTNEIFLYENRFRLSGDAFEYQFIDINDKGDTLLIHDSQNGYVQAKYNSLTKRTDFQKIELADWYASQSVLCQKALLK